jgi:hypothetical protein
MPNARSKGNLPDQLAAAFDPIPAIRRSDSLRRMASGEGGDAFKDPMVREF